MSAVNPVTEALVLESLRFTSLGEIQGEGHPSPSRHPLTVSRSDRAADAHPPQQPRRGQEPYSRRTDNNTSSRPVGQIRGTNSSSSTTIRHRPENEFVVDVIFSAHSDGLMAILRRA